MAKFYDYEVGEGSFRRCVKTDAVEREQQLDGCYIIKSDVSSDRLSKSELVETYKRLQNIETAWRQMKTVQLEIRPIRRWKPDRVRSHIFLRMLSYLVQHEMRQRLKPLLDSDGEGKNRQWTFDSVLNRLSSLREEEREIEGRSFTPTQNQTMNSLKSFASFASNTPVVTNVKVVLPHKPFVHAVSRSFAEG